jgi:hypothetical protein
MENTNMVHDDLYREFPANVHGVGKVLGFQGGEYEGDCCLGCCAV